ncbi:MAG: hypothetical protein HC945_01505 [Nitrosarchaeum sp.]|nr:hypothetical protein [Nitrosarchaeum sp.]
MREFLRPVEKAEHRYHFHKQGRSAASIEELGFLLEQLSHDEVAEHTHPGGNHFAPWVRSVIGDHELAMDLERLTRKDDIVKAVQHRVFMIGALSAPQQPRIEPSVPQPVGVDKQPAPQSSARVAPARPVRVAQKKAPVRKARERKTVASQEPHDFNAYKQELINRLLKSAEPSLKKRIREFQRRKK